jgi:HemY protein
LNGGEKAPMRVTIWLILLFVIAVVAATALGQNDGILTLVWRGWRVELSLNLALFLLALAGLGGYLILRGLDLLLGFPKRAGEWRALQRERAAHGALREAFSAYFSGRYSRAQREARRAIALQDEYPDLPLGADHRLLSQMVAAGSLHRLQDRGGRDAILTQILQTQVPSNARAAHDGALLLAAEWSLDDGQAEKAEAYLAALPAGVARRTLALRLRLKTARLAKRTGEALELARLLSKHQAFSPLASQGLVRALALEHLDAARDMDQLQAQWQQLSVEERRDSVLLQHAARKAIIWQAFGAARAWMEPVWGDLQRMSTEERKRLALTLAASTKGADAAWLERAEAAAKANPADAAVAFAAGMLCLERQLWGKARHWLEPVVVNPQLDPADRQAAAAALAQMASQEGSANRPSEAQGPPVVPDAVKPVL